MKTSRSNSILMAVLVSASLVVVLSNTSFGADASLSREEFRNNRSEILNAAKEEFKAKKESIRNQMKSGQMTVSEAKSLLEKTREETIEKTKDTLKKEKEERRALAHGRIKAIARNKLSKLTTKIESLPESERKIRYQKLLKRIDETLTSPSISAKNRAILEIVREIVMEK